MITRVSSCNEFVLKKGTYIELNYKKLVKAYDCCTSPTAKEKMAIDMLELNWENNELKEAINKLVDKNEVEHNKAKFIGILFIIYVLFTIAIWFCLA